MQPQAILFDSGGTLMRPTGRSWMPGRHFEAFAAEHGICRNADSESWAAAMHAGNTVLAGQPVIPTTTEETELFAQYFLILSRSLGLPDDSATIRLLAEETVHGKGHEEPYDGVIEALNELQSKHYRLFLLANGWPSLSRRYQELGLRDHFEFFVTSTQLGIKKTGSAGLPAGL